MQRHCWRQPKMCFVTWKLPGILRMKTHHRFRSRLCILVLFQEWFWSVTKTAAWFKHLLQFFRSVSMVVSKQKCVFESGYIPWAWIKKKMHVNIHVSSQRFSYTASNGLPLYFQPIRSTVLSRMNYKIWVLIVPATEIILSEMTNYNGATESVSSVTIQYPNVWK